MPNILKTNMDLLSAIYGNNSTSDGLVAYWRMEEASGNRLSVTGSYPLTPQGSPLPGNDTGKNGNALALVNANGQYLDGGPILHFSGPLTISCWVNGAGFAQTTHYIVAKGISPSLEWRLARHGGGIGFTGYTDGTTAVVSNLASNLTIGQWAFVMGWWDGSNLFARTNDGETAAKAFTGPLFNGGASLYVGWGAPGAFQYWDGLIDELGIWNRVLTPTERDALYNGGAGKFY